MWAPHARHTADWRDGKWCQCVRPPPSCAAGEEDYQVNPMVSTHPGPPDPPQADVVACTVQPPAFLPSLPSGRLGRKAGGCGNGLGVEPGSLSIFRSCRTSRQGALFGPAGVSLHGHAKHVRFGRGRLRIPGGPVGRRQTDAGARTGSGYRRTDAHKTFTQHPGGRFSCRRRKVCCSPRATSYKLECSTASSYVSDKEQ